ncbi:hypothetical protein OSCI_2110006 [Kamptonema sp. PCC 6506]|nr:hypothetical protein OSCI_2110006 [Kamptonema sp. PCC 6506]
MVWAIENVLTVVAVAIFDRLAIARLPQLNSDPGLASRRHRLFNYSLS